MSAIYEIERIIETAVADELHGEGITCLQSMDTKTRDDKAMVFVRVELGGAANHTHNVDGMKLHDIYDITLQCAVLTNRMETYTLASPQSEHWSTVGKVRYLFARLVPRVNTRLSNHLIQFLLPQQTSTAIDSGVDTTTLQFSGQVQLIF